MDKDATKTILFFVEIYTFLLLLTKSSCRYIRKNSSSGNLPNEKKDLHINSDLEDITGWAECTLSRFADDNKIAGTSLK